VQLETRERGLGWRRLSKKTAGWKKASMGLGAWREGNGRELEDSHEDRVHFLLMFYVNI
jgi:hypothetical protein